MKQIPFFCLLICSLMFLACGGKTKTDDRQAFQTSLIEYDSLAGKTVTFSVNKMVSICNGKILSNLQRDEFYSGKPFRVILFFGAENCSTCTLQMFYRWDEMMDFVGRDQVEYFYILRPDGNSEINLLVDALNQCYFSLPVLIDERGLFEQENTALGLCGASAAFFVDDEGKILLAGSPADDEGRFVGKLKHFLNSLSEI